MKLLAFTIFLGVTLAFPKYNQKTDQLGFSTLNGGTTGGKGGVVKYATSSESLIEAVKGNEPKIVYVKGPITLEARPKVGNNTSILGLKNPEIIGFGLHIDKASNVIVRGLQIHHVVDNDAISATFSNNIWIDHNEFWSDRDHGFDYYDGLVDITKGSDYVTISWNIFRDHWKTSLVGGDPEAIATEGDKYHITYHHNIWRNLMTRTPALRFSTAHLFNNFIENVGAQGVHPRSFAQALVEGNVFRNVSEPISTYGKVIPEDSPNSGPDGDYEPDGFVNARYNDYGGGKNNITQVGTLWSMPYKYKHAFVSLRQVEKVVKKGSGPGKFKL